MRFNFYSKVKALLLMLVLCTAFAVTVSAQALSGAKTVDPSGSGPNNYLTLKAAIDSLNIHGVGTGGVTFNIVAGFTETAPVGGYALTATGTAANPISFVKSGAGANPLLTAYVGGTGTPTTLVADGIFRLVGSDYVTIDGIDLTENASNTANPATMEYGYGLFKASRLNGCQNVTIQNCTVTLSRINFASSTSPMVEGSVGILSINSKPDSSTTVLVPTNRAGTNSYNKFYKNTIQNANYGMALIGYAASTPFLAADTLNDIGGTAESTGNTIINFGGGSASTNPSAAIRTLAQYGINVSYNTVDNNTGSGVNHVSTLRGIYLNTASNASATIRNNTVRLNGGGTSSQISGIENVSGGSGTNNTINITNNKVFIQSATATSASIYGIYNQGSAFVVNIRSNSIDSIKVTTATSTATINGILNSAGTTVNVISNTISNIQKVAIASGSTVGIYTSGGTTQRIKLNTVSGITVTGASGSGGLIYGIQASTGTIIIDSNNVYGLLLNKTAASAVVYGIYDGSSPTNENYNYNTIYNLTNNGTGILNGIYSSTAAGTKTISNNTVYTLLGKGAVDGIRTGISTPSVFKNKIYDLTSAGASGITSGINVTSVSSGTANIYNNFISDLKSPIVTGSTEGVRGINITSTSTTTTVSLSHNTIYLNATSTGTNFSASGVYHTYNATATTSVLLMRNNIIVNKSVPNGTGIVAAFRRSASTNLGNYSTSSNGNIFYAGTPAANRLIYYDGTNSDQQLSDFKTRVAPREIYSSTEDVPFVNAAGNDLHVTGGVATLVESNAIPISFITSDIDGNVRPGPAGSINGGGTIPDIGADEIDGIPLFPFGDIIPPVFTFDSISPAPFTCLTTSHTIYAKATDASGIDSVIINWTLGSLGAQTPILMTSLGSNRYSGTIPSMMDSLITYSFRTVDASSNKNFTLSSGDFYLDKTFNVEAIANNLTVTAGDTVKLEAITPVSPTGTGTIKNAASSTSITGYPAPFGNYYQGAKNQMLIRATELKNMGFGAGPIKSVAFDVTTVSTSALTGFTVSLKHTTLSDITALQFGGFTDVYTNASYVPSALTGYANNKIVFSTPFVWDGVSNIILQTCFANTGFTTNAVFNQTATPFVSTAVYRADLTTVCSSTDVTATFTYNQRPNMLLEGTNAVKTATWTESSGGGLVSNNTPKTTAIPLLSGSYVYTATASNGVCSNTGLVTVTVLNPAAPVANFSISNDTAFTGGQRTTITFTDKSSNLPSAWKWSFIPNKVSYVNGTSSTSRNPQVQFDSAGLYSIKLVASNVTGADSLTKVDSVLAVIQYCLSGATTGAGQDIGNVTINFGTDTLLNNGIALPATANATATGTYSDFTTTVAPVKLQFGKTYNLSIAHITSTTSSTSGRAMYLDLNHDGDFTDAGEKLFTSASYLAAGVNSTGTFTIPRNAPFGFTRLRVVLSNSYSDPSSCQVFTNGETEDYLVEIVRPIGDFYPPDFSSAAVTPASGQCLPSTHNVSVTITDTTGVDTAWVVWRVAGVLQPEIVMTKNVNVYSATIPTVAPGKIVSYSFKARDISVNKNVGTFAGGELVDAVFNVDGTATADSIVLGNTVRFNTKIYPEPFIGSGTTVGTGTPNPYYTTFWGNRSEFIIRASELSAQGYVAGQITSLGLNVGTVSTTLPLTNFTISMANTTATEATGTFQTGLSQVYTNASYTVVPNTFNNHVFQTPFVWDGVSNVVIQTCFNNSNWNGSQQITYTTTPFVSCMYFVDDVSTVCGTATGTTSSNRPNFRLGQVSTVALNWGVVPSANAGLLYANTDTVRATPTALGIYKFYVTGNNGTCTYTDTVSVKVIPPTPPVARFGVDKRLAYANTKVTFSDSTLNLPDSLFWSFTPNTVTYVNGTSRKSKNPEVNFTAAGMYSVKLVAQNLGGKDSLTKVDYVEIIPAYCASNAVNAGDEDISRVRVGSFAHSSQPTTPISSNTSANKTYSDLLSVVGFKARIAVEDTLEVSLINSGATFYDSRISAWIDMNKDGVFDNTSEIVFSQLSTANANDRTKKATFTIPPGASVGNTVMRVVTWETGFTPGTGPCGTYGYGETEDYIINILPPPPGDYYPPAITNITLTPDSSCNAVSHTITANIFDSTAVDTAWIYYSVNNVDQTPIVMTKPTSGNIYTGVIGPQGSGVVRFRIFARDLSPININSAFSTSRIYQDKYFNVSAGSDKFIGIGQTANLSANTSLDKSFRITEFNLFNYTGGCGSSNGSQCTWPAYLPTTMYDDNLELTNLSTSPADLSGHTLLTEGTNSSITFPAGTIVPAGGVVIVHLSSAGTADPSNLVFRMTSGNFAPGSGSSFGIVLKNAQGAVVDAVALNSYSFTSANGVTSADWSGAGVVSPSGQAGATLQGADLNNNTNWITADITNIVSIGYKNPNLPTLPSSSTVTWTGGLLTAPVVGGSITTPVHPSLGVFEYIATSSNGVCTTSDTVKVNVVSAPVVNIGGPTGLICGTTPRVLDAGNPGSTYIWRFNDVQVATTRTYSAAAAGKYKVTVTNQAGLSTSDSITLSTAPAFTFTMPDRTLCTGGTITLDAGAQSSYLWSTGATTRTIQVNATGTYHVTVMNSTGCSASDTFEVTTTTPPAFTLGNDQAICGSAPVLLDAGNAGSTYLWNTGATTQTITAANAGTYSVTVTTTSGCILMDTVVITNLVAPVVNLGSDQAICPGASATLDAGNTTGATYSWNTGASTQSISVTTAGVYIVTVTGSNGCSTKDTVNVTLKAAPVVNLGNALELCTSDTVTLDAGNAGSTYLWSTGATTQTIRVTNAATYSVAVTNPTTGCTTSGSVVVTNKPEPVSTYTIVSSVGQSITFQATTTSGLQYAWNFGDPTSPSNTSQLASPTHVFTSGGMFSVRLTVTNVATGCKSTTVTQVLVSGLGNDFADVFKLGAAPNPFAGQTNIKYVLPENANSVTVEVYDMIGRKVADVINNEYQAAGEYTFNYKNEDLQTASGVYMVRLTVDGKVAYIRIVDIAKK